MAQENKPLQDALQIAQSYRDAVTDPVVLDSVDETIQQIQTKLEELNNNQ